MKNWDSLEAFFRALADTEYVVLRNFEYFGSAHFMQEHPDIDLLCRDRDAVLKTTQSVSRVKDPNDPIHRKVLVDHTEVALDLRCVGDGYYDAEWETALLQGRILWNNLCCVPNPEDYYYSLLYHAFIQKRTLNSDYDSRLRTMALPLLPEEQDPVSIRTLEAYMRAKGYFYTYPESAGTIFNIKASDPRLVRRDFKRKMNRYVAALKYSLRN